MTIRVGARDSPLSKAQVEEVRGTLVSVHPPLAFVCRWIKTTGDLDKKTSLRELERSDFFTRELDAMLLQGEIDVAIHSAKDLPDPLPKGLALIALTQGVDPRDSLVFRSSDTLETLPPGAVVATSSLRREERVRALRSDLSFVDIRGTIGERLARLEAREVDAVVIAEAALIRLRLTHLNRLILPGETALHQGRLAILAREGEAELKQLFAPLHAERRVLYLGLDPTGWKGEGTLLHYPVIRTERIEGAELQQALALWPQFSHVIFTSRSAVRHWWEVGPVSFTREAIAIGKGTAAELQKRGVAPLIAKEETQEGVIALLEKMDLRGSFLFIPGSKKTRPVLFDFLAKRGIRFFQLALYDTLFQEPAPRPSLEEVDEIVFTSPSTVEGFLRIYGALPHGKRLTPIGQITGRVLALRASVAALLSRR